MIIAAIPARLGSTRLPNKMLLNRTGKPLLHHTIDRVLESKVKLIYVLTPDKPIYEFVKSLKMNRVSPVLTGHAESGTERIAKFCTTHVMNNEHIVINFQGDEPELPGLYIDKLIDALDEYTDVATLAASATLAESADSSIVKTVIDHNDMALWFSRLGIPHGGPWLKHIGIYAYRVKFLRKLFFMDKTTYAGERLEQLQWLQAGYKIHVSIGEVKHAGIDTEYDYERFVERRLRSNI